MHHAQSSAVEILPHAFTEYAIGSVKHATCRITKTGRNIAMPKVEQPNKTGGNPVPLKKGGEKWWCLSDSQKEFWREIALEHDFWSKWQAFMSSFLISVELNGLDYTMNNELIYYSSNARDKRYEHYENSIKRNRGYQVDESYYPKTEETLKKYLLAHDSPLIYVRLLNLVDVNNALKCKMIYRTDPVVDYEYYPEQTGTIEKGYYVRTERPRSEEERYELFEYIHPD